VYRKVLVTIDASKCAQRAFERALEIVKAGNGTLTIVHVLELSLTVGFGKRLSAEVETFFGKDAKMYLAEHMEKAATKDVKANTILAKGHPAKAILDAAKSNEVDIIVMGSRGLGGMKGLTLGSISHAVVQHSKVPVLVVR
jgi:nucleotide-binding universal stress UspA family protein